MVLGRFIGYAKSFFLWCYLDYHLKAYPQLSSPGLQDHCSVYIIIGYFISMSLARVKTFDLSISFFSHWVFFQGSFLIGLLIKLGQSNYLKKEWVSKFISYYETFRLSLFSATFSYWRLYVILDWIDLQILLSKPVLKLLLPIPTQ